MKKTMTVLALLLAALMILLAAPALAEGDEAAFAEWNEGAPALQTLIEYVESVTDESSPDYIPPADRIAVFDMDGTLCGELYPTYLEYYTLAWRILVDPSYEPDAEMLEFGRMLRDCALDNSFPSDMAMQHAVHAAKAYSGMTLTQFSDFITNLLVKEVDGFEGMTYANSFFLPMIDRFICRTFLEGVLDVPYEQIIGMDVDVEALHQEGADGLEYMYTSEDTIIRTDRLLIKNLKMNKVKQIVQEIGRQPVLSFGNSSGDTSMHNYTLYGNKYKSASFMLIADDEERDYGNTEKAQGLREKWEAAGYNVISMKDDFRTIYGDDVRKTGEFHWLEELAENRQPAEETEQPAEETEQPAEGADAETGTAVQYVMYLGTNDKDSNKPVFTEAEAMEKAKEILVRHFGGYTIQEASGGWIDGDYVCQEYTLVIYLSDTTADQVHAAADELISVFNQSSILIQEIPWQSEFYSGAN